MGCPGRSLPEYRASALLEPRTINVQVKLPERYQAEASRRLREISEAQTHKECKELRDRYVAELIDRGQWAAVETVLRDWEDFVTFYHYPKEHWIHLRTTKSERIHLQRGEAEDRPVPQDGCGGIMPSIWGHNPFFATGRFRSLRS